MSVLVVVGAQWGDEGKGGVVDHLATQAQVVARYQGGTNTGHTVLSMTWESFVCTSNRGYFLSKHHVCDRLGSGDRSVSFWNKLTN